MMPRTALNNPPDEKKELTGKQQQAALLLASGSTIDATAKKIGAGEKTVDTWKKKPEFLAAIRAAEDDLYQDNLRFLKRTSRAAIATLITCMSEKYSAYVRVQAASKLLDAAMEAQRIQELETRLVELEDLIKAGVVESSE